MRVGETMFVLSFVVLPMDLRSFDWSRHHDAPFRSISGLASGSGSAGQTKRGDYSNVCERNDSPQRWPSARRSLVI